MQRARGRRLSRSLRALHEAGLVVLTDEHVVLADALRKAVRAARRAGPTQPIRGTAGGPYADELALLDRAALAATALDGARMRALIPPAVDALSGMGAHARRPAARSAAACRREPPRVSEPVLAGCGMRSDKTRWLPSSRWQCGRGGRSQGFGRRAASMRSAGRARPDGARALDDAIVRSVGSLPMRPAHSVPGRSRNWRVRRGDYASVASAVEVGLPARTRRPRCAWNCCAVRASWPPTRASTKPRGSATGRRLRWHGRTCRAQRRSQRA